MADEPPQAERRVNAIHEQALRQRYVIAALGVVYLLQALSPLRLDNDSVVYLRAATQFADGRPVENTGLPFGYPVFVAILDRLGLGNSVAFVIANFLFIAAGLAAVHYMLRQGKSEPNGYVIPLTLLAAPVIKYLAMPLPEAMFLGLSMTALAIMTAASRADNSQRRPLLLLATIVSLVAISARVAGVALLPPLLWATFRTAQAGCAKDLRPAQSRHLGNAGKYVLVVMAIGVAVVSWLAISGSAGKYLHDAVVPYPRAFHGKTADHLSRKVEIIGAIVLNLPFRSHERIMYLLPGLSAMCFVALILRSRPSLPKSPAAIYLTTFVVMLLLWPYSAWRLWMPIMPLLIGFAESRARRAVSTEKSRRMVQIYVAYFCVVGVVALAYTTRITFSGDNFGKRYGTNGGMATPDSTGWVNEDHNSQVRALTRRYGYRY